METLLEQQRKYHEEREKLMDIIITESLTTKNTIKDHINSDHRIKYMQDKLIKVTKELKELYEDKDGLRKEEIKIMSGPKAFGQFYGRLNSIKDFYKEHPNEIAIPMSIEYEQILQDLSNPIETKVNFTDEEGKGKYLDLHEGFEMYLNLKGIQPLDYVTYLTQFDHFYDIPVEYKTLDYVNYLQFLLNYFIDYCGKVYPLLDLIQEMQNVLRNFEVEWDIGHFPGWPKNEIENNEELSDINVDLNAYSSPEELASLGLDTLKNALKSLNLKCGGTLEQRAQRLFTVKGKVADDIPKSYLVKDKKFIEPHIIDKVKFRDIAAMEGKLYFFVDLFSDQKADTKENVQRKQAMGVGEEEESSDDEIGGPGAGINDADLEEEEAVIYNPKNLPLDWDGKPIPYWLYKLHGLNINYNCEICGNQVYRGPKAFQKHFSEWRHAHGMRCLGIPNTAHFANVTLIEDAITLWEKIKHQKTIEKWRPEMEEEFEDSEGNVVNRRTYEDLKRQDLL